MLKITVKWNKQVLELNSMDESTISVNSLKKELEILTGVPMNRQKLMSKSKNLWKGVLKDDYDIRKEIDWNKVDKSNIIILLMGSAEQIKTPTKQTVFLEDLPVEQRAKVVEPAGLVNLGNTCYLNSVVQCLRAIPELQNGLKQNNQNNNASNSNTNLSNNTPSQLLVHALNETLIQLDNQTEPVQPVKLVMAVKLAFPQFAQLTPSGTPMQQDAEEFYSGLLSNFNTNIANRIFGLDLQETLTCDECPDEPIVTTHDFHRKLVCNIQGGNVPTTAPTSSADTSANNVNYINEGIQLGLTGKIEKHSNILNRDAIWTRQQCIQKLPIILVVQFGRFYWKATPDSQDHAGVKCKVMKPVTFNDTLDIYDFCSKDIQSIIKKNRNKKLLQQEDEIQKKLKGEAINNDKPKEEQEETKQDEDTKMETEDDDDEELKKALAMSMETEDNEDTTDAAASILGPDIPTDFLGYYELFGVVTHKGRDADGGHYMAWVKADNNDNNVTVTEKIADTDVLNEDWYVFDDDEVSPCKTEDVLKLKGGGDWHMSYLNFYRIKK